MQKEFVGVQLEVVWRRNNPQILHLQALAVEWICAGGTQQWQRRLIERDSILVVA